MTLPTRLVIEDDAAGGLQLADATVRQGERGRVIAALERGHDDVWLFSSANRATCSPAELAQGFAALAEAAWRREHT